MKNADLREAILAKANLIGVNLTGADLREAVLTRANIIGADLTNANLCRTTMPDGTESKQGCEQESFASWA